MRMVVARQLITDEYMKSQEKHKRIFSTYHEGYGILLEEVDELWDAIKADDFNKAQKEAAHVGAMAMKFLTSFEKFEPQQKKP